MLEGIRSVVSFLTVLPAGPRGAPPGLGAAARSMHLFPLAGIAVGLAAGGVGYGAHEAGADPLIAALLTVAALAMVTGMHHADGLADLADGLMARGSRGRRLAVMRDPAVGSAGATAVALCLAGTLGTLSLAGSGAQLLAAVVLSEVSAKFAMVVVAAAGRPAAPGSGAAFVAAMRDRRRPAAAAALAAAACAALGGPAGLAMLCAAAAAAAVLALASTRGLGGVTGDAMGAANEVARLAALVVAFWVPA